jgi:hypothetical protein
MLTSSKFLPVELKQQAGEMPAYNRLATLAVTGYAPLTATGQVRTGPCLFIGVQCLTAGTVALVDSLSATGNSVFPATAMTAGQVVYFGGPASQVVAVEMVYGLYATVTSGTYNVLAV